MAHIVQENTNYRTVRKSIVPYKPTDRQVQAFNRINFERTRKYHPEAELCIDGRPIANYKTMHNVYDSVPFGFLRMLIIALSTSAALLTVFLFHFWLALLAIVIVPIATVLHRRRAVAVLSRDDKKELMAFYEQPTLLDLMSPDPILVWAISLEQLASRATQRRVVSVDTLSEWTSVQADGCDDVEYVKLCLLLLKMKFTRQTEIDFTGRQAVFPWACAKIESFQESHGYDYLSDDSLEKWATNWGDEVFLVKDAILDDHDIRGTYELSERIQQSADDPFNAHTADEQSLLEKLEQCVVERVRAIYEGAELRLRQESEATHAGTAAMADQLFSQ